VNLSRADARSVGTVIPWVARFYTETHRCFGRCTRSSLLRTECRRLPNRRELVRARATMTCARRVEPGTRGSE
jgi:hypothetical protein